jgi:small subunit ribosomal protein S20
MPNHSATLKSLRQNAKRQIRNVATKSKIRTLIKKVRVAVSNNNLSEAKVQLQRAVSALDTAAKKHVIHPRNASRKKSRLMKLLSKTQTPVSAQPEPNTSAVEEVEEVSTAPVTEETANEEEVKTEE